MWQVDIQSTFPLQGNKMSKLNILPENPDPSSKGRFPSWLHRPLIVDEALQKTNTIVEKYNIHTVCEECKCPNRLECYSRGTATFLILGKACTRACGFCDIDFIKTPLPPEEDEAIRVAFSVRDLKLRHVVITMVARDDLIDGGATHLAKVIKTVRIHNPAVTIEVLTSDFAGNFDAINIVLGARPEIFNHNIETVERLSPKVRHKATYQRTLEVLSYVAKSTTPPIVKSGIMIGLGESQEEVKKTLEDLHKAGSSIVTIGQYLQASRLKLRVQSFVTPEQFKRYEEFGRSIGIKEVYSGPFVRSSYNAEEIALSHGYTPS
jgi:lipoic acid synthetase